MDDFVNILQRDYGLKPQGKSAPMSMPSAVKSTSSPSPLFSSSSAGSRNQNSAENASFGSMPGGIFKDEDFLFGTSAASKNGMESASSMNSDVFGAAPAFDKIPGTSSIYDYDDVFGIKSSSSQTYQNPKQAASHHNDDIFEMHSNHRDDAKPTTTTSSSPSFSSSAFSSSAKKNMNSSARASSSSLPIFDAPLYDDDENDIFGGLPGIKSTSVVYDDVFGSVGGGMPSSLGKDSSSVLEDILGVPTRTDTKDKASSTYRSVEPSAPPVDFDDELLPGFGGTEPARTWKTDNEEHISQKSGKDIPRKPENDSFHMAEEDPFNMFQKTSTTTTEGIGDSDVWGSPQSDTRDRVNDENIAASRNSSRHGSQTQSPYRRKVNEPSLKQESEQKIDDSAQLRKSHQVNSLSNDNVRSSSIPMNHAEEISSKQNKKISDEGANVSPQRSTAAGRRKSEVWVSVEDVKLVTQPTKAPPPSRRPPPLPATRQSSMVTNRVNGEAEGRHKRNALSDADVMEQSAATSASARAAEEVMERARFKQYDGEKGTDTRASRMRNDKDKGSEIMGDDGRAFGDEGSHPNEAEERHAKETEKEEKEKEAREKWRKEREKEKEREREREKDRIAVERATQEARERAALEARQRAAVERATAEARERAAAEARERAAVERANTEVRERAATEARERAAAERAAVERANAEARERAVAEAREKAAVERATAEARERAAAEARERAAAERAAVEKATAEARERAAAEARERAAAERAAAEARERAAAERAAVERATSEARARAERAAVERATKEARDRAAERAALDARERAEKAAAERNAAAREQRRNENDFEAFFSSNSRSSSAAKQRSPPKSNNFPVNEGSHQKSSEANASKNMPTSFADDWTSLFGAASNAGEFQEVEGESAERRKARLERHQRTAERAAKALDEKNKRDLQTQREQAERHRAGDILDSEIKRWAAGKEGNIRALLSTLQYVLWPECGWQPVSLTDLITAAAVKKVYRKATLCVHPDKVQQKGATIQQKYIAEKVFDLLKEAWNKFNSEELF